MLKKAVVGGVLVVAVLTYLMPLPLHSLVMGAVCLVGGFVIAKAS